MTRKHFEVLAAAVAEIENETARRKAAEKTAVACALTNPRFNRERFFTACNVK